jgi:hypothetical protein
MWEILEAIIEPGLSPCTFSTPFACQAPCAKEISNPQIPKRKNFPEVGVLYPAKLLK